MFGRICLIRTSFVRVVLFLFLLITDCSAEWITVYSEDFEALNLPRSVNWYVDQQTDTSLPKPCFVIEPDFCEPHFLPQDALPAAFRFSLPIGHSSAVNSISNGITIESYTRDPATDFSSLIARVVDPENKNNHVLRLRSVQHTDANILRSSMPLKGDYRVSLRVGHVEFGSGDGLNGYDGDEMAIPWLEQSSVKENGFYWLALSDVLPRPQSNIWWHHHRKAVIDSDNHWPAWSQIWNGSKFIKSGKQPVMMFVLNGAGQASLATGKPFKSFSANAWQPSGQIKAVDAYLPKQWYDVVIMRIANQLTLQISGRFAYGGTRHYVAQIALDEECVWHSPRTTREAEKIKPACFIQQNLSWASWKQGELWPDYFFLGDPHINFYEGEMLIDDIRIESWQPREPTS